MAVVRKLNELGVGEFLRYIEELSVGSVDPPPTDLLTDKVTSEPLEGSAEVELQKFSNKLVAAEYLGKQLAQVPRAELDHNIRLWTWLSLFYFDQVCPPGADRRRVPGAAVRHVLSDHAYRYYRHLLAGPHRLFQVHGSNARIFLCGPLHTHGEFSEQLASRMERISNRSLIEAVDQLYFDSSADGGGAPKRGAATNKPRPGTLRRLITVLDQLDLTYDLYAMTPQQILGFV